MKRGCNLLKKRTILFTNGRYDMEIKKQTGLKGILTVPGDKSISHRSSYVWISGKWHNKNLSFSGRSRLSFHDFLLPENGDLN